MNDKAEDLEALRNAVIDASNISTALWLSYLFVLFYFAIAAGGVTHSDLFFERPVKLPFLNVNLPLLGFFFLAPMIFLVVHAYVLLHIVLLTGKVGALDVKLRAHFKQSPLLAEAWRRQLPNNIFVQFLAGPLDVRKGTMGLMLRLVAQISLIVGPVALLILFQLQFLSFHRWEITWLHRVAVVADIALLWTFWPSIERGSTTRFGWRDLKQRWVAIAAVASSVMILFVFGLATYPDEWLNKMPSLQIVPWPRLTPAATESAFQSTIPWILRGGGVAAPVCGPPELNASTAQPSGKVGPSGFFAWVKSIDWEWTSLYTLIIVGDVNPTTLRPTSLWPNSNRLVLPGADVVDHTKFDTEQKIKAVVSTRSLRGRHLENAVLCGADLRKVDFTGAWLKGAILNKAQLQSAVLNNAKLQDAKLNSVSLQGASLKFADLQGAEFLGSSLQATSFDDANAGFDDTHPEGARFSSDLLSSNLQAASFARSHLERAHFEASNLEAATFDGAHLQNASFRVADLQGATLGGAYLEGADLSNAMVWRVDVRLSSVVKNLCDNVVKLAPCWKYQTAAHGLDHRGFCNSATLFSDDLFKKLRELIQYQVLPGDLQSKALTKIDQRLDPKKPLPGEEAMADAWRECLEIEPIGFAMKGPSQ